VYVAYMWYFVQHYHQVYRQYDYLFISHSTLCGQALTGRSPDIGKVETVCPTKWIYDNNRKR